MSQADAQQVMFDKDEVIVPKLLRPKDAATLILTRRDKDAVRILMGRRHGDMAFMAGKYVFPGGRLDLCDLRIAPAAPLPAAVAAKLGPRADALALAAIRETFEETGVLVGVPSAAPPRTRAKAWAAFFAHKIVPDLSALTLIGRAITPPKRPRRFDARFFMADAGAIAKTLDSAETQELLTPCWVTLAEARALDLPSITRRMIDEAEARLAGEHDRPVPFFRFSRGKATMSTL